MIRFAKWEKDAPPSAAELEKALRGEGYATYAWSDAPGARYGEHEHPHEECRWVLEGSMKIGSGGKVYEMGPGDRLDMPPRTVHWAEAGPEGVRYLCGDR